MRRLSVTALLLCACGPQVPFETDGDTGIVSTTAADPSSTNDDGLDDSNDTEIVDYDFGGAWDPKPCNPDAPCLVDILVVVDNTATMGDAQASLTRSLVQLVGRIERLDAEMGRTFDVQMMFTTTDMNNTLCEAFLKPDYTPARGAPTATGCNARINRFTGLGNDPEVVEEICLDVCWQDVVPGDPFVAFVGATGGNVPEGPALDVDQDGVSDSTIAQAVACLAPQGIDGCGYESPLESMLQALNPDATWNEGERPFLRDGSDVIVVVATDETDCSMDGPDVALDPQYWEIRPGSESGSASSALCWNAGMKCNEPDSDGVYTDCVTDDTALLPVSRYVEYLDFLAEDQDRGVFVVAVDGIPTGSNEWDLVFREWREDDLFPSELRDAVHVEDMTFDYKIGPACSDADREMRALPNPRLDEVCRSANVPTVLTMDGTQCCVESICDAEIQLDCVDDFLDILVDGHPGFG